MSSKVIERPKPEEYAPAFERYVSRVTESDVMAALSRQTEELPAALATVHGEGERYRYAPGKWSVRELVGHLIDTERIMAYRAVCVARGETASLPGFDENAYVANATFDDYPLPELLNEFVHVREGHLRLLPAPPPRGLAAHGAGQPQPDLGPGPGLGDGGPRPSPHGRPPGALPAPLPGLTVGTPLTKRDEGCIIHT